MSNNTTYEIMEKEALHFFVGDRVLEDQEIRSLTRSGGYLIQIGCGELVSLFDKWQEIYIEEDKGLNPFSGYLVSATANIQTKRDEVADYFESQAEKLRTIFGRSYDDEEVQRLTAEAETQAEVIMVSPEQTADFLTIQQLAKLILSITVEHPLDEFKTDKLNRFYLEGDPSDPDFREEVIRLGRETYNDMAGASTSPELTEDEIEIDEMFESTSKEFLANYGIDKYRVRDREYLFETRSEDGLGEARVPTTLDAARQLKQEAETYGFKLVERRLEK